MRYRAELQGDAVACADYWRHAAQQRNPALRCARAQLRDRTVWQANLQDYGPDKVPACWYRGCLPQARQLAGATKKASRVTHLRATIVKLFYCKFLSFFELTGFIVKLYYGQ
jgi:hypothetical protein